MEIVIVDYNFSDRQLEEFTIYGLKACSVEYHESPLGSRAALLKTQASSCQLKSIRAGDRKYIRLLDSYFVPDPADPILDTALCDYIAGKYEKTIDVAKNIDNIRCLLEIAIESVAIPARIEILDFGCGTGLSVAALQQLPAEQQGRIVIRGTDPSPQMLKVAASRGLSVVPFAEWLGYPAALFDVIMAAYVLHFGLTDEELIAFRRQLRDRGVIVANYHKGTDLQVRTVARRFLTLGFRTTIVQSVRHNPVLIFRLD